MRITSFTRDEAFELVRKSQELHYMICSLLVEHSEEAEQQVLLKLSEVKEIAREL